MKKWNLFTYIVSELLEWHDSVASESSYQSFTKLKLLKLLFFVAATDESEDEEGMLTIFDNFWAMPYGHVESDIYNRMRSENIDDYNFIYTQKNTASKAEMAVADSAIKKLKEYNPMIITYDPIALVELSHEWYSWKSMYDIARSLNKYSIKIPKEVIQKEIKFYKL